MKITVEYSRREAYRIRQIRRKLHHLGVSLAQVVLVGSLVGAGILGTAMDSPELGPVIKGFWVCIGLAVITYIGLRIEGR